jgi:hypothetical protein
MALAITALAARAGLWRRTLRHRLPLMLVVLALPACAAASEPDSQGAPAGPVSYEVRSWGRLLLRWQVNPDGTGEIWRGAREQKDAGEVRKFRLLLQGDPLRSFTAEMEEARVATQKGIDCEKVVTDLPYGSVTWDYPGAKQVYSFDAGCRSEDGDAAMDIVSAASTIVETMASIDAKPYMTESASPR